MTPDSGNVHSLPKMLVIGVGNDYRGDDALGVMVARRLEARHLPQTIVLTEQREGTALITAWDQTDAELVILIDAVSSGAEPGTVNRMVVTSQDFSTPESTSSTHGIGVEQAIELARTLGKLPCHLVLYMVEGKQFTLGSDLSPEVECALEFVINSICHDIHALQNG